MFSSNNIGHALRRIKARVKRSYSKVESRLKAGFPLCEFIRATRSEIRNQASWLAKKFVAKYVFANQSRCRTCSSREQIHLVENGHEDIQLVKRKSSLVCYICLVKSQ